MILRRFLIPDTLRAMCRESLSGMRLIIIFAPPTLLFCAVSGRRSHCAGFSACRRFL
ncbi:hypothetical protein [Emticicia sp. 17c]|uniref:hypothetical protein n=1 Tax=Emticicia sp. 17c TaxID=3127704 RepID=UPI00301CF746